MRLREDPVRMLRAVALAARLNFTIDPPVLAAIRTHRHEISHSSAPRLLEEYYKILRAGSAEKTTDRTTKSANAAARAVRGCASARRTLGSRQPVATQPAARRMKRP